MSSIGSESLIIECKSRGKAAQMYNLPILFHSDWQSKVNYNCVTYVQQWEELENCFCMLYFTWVFFFSFMIQCNPSDNLGMLFEIILSGVVLVPVLARTQERAGSFLSLMLCCTFCCQCVVQTVLNKLLWLFCVETLSSYDIFLSLFRTIRKCDIIMDYLKLPKSPTFLF